MFVADQGMIKFTFGHPAKVHSVDLDNTVGVNTWAEFAGSDENVVVMATSPSLKMSYERYLNRCARLASPPSKNRGLSSSIIGAVAQLRVLPKVFRKLCLLEPRYRQNLARMSDESVGFCYKTSAIV